MNNKKGGSIHTHDNSSACIQTYIPAYIHQVEVMMAAEFFELQWMDQIASLLYFVVIHHAVCWDPYS